MSELIVLSRIKDLPRAERYRQLTPYTLEEARAAAAQATGKVYYWKSTASVFIPISEAEDGKKIHAKAKPGSARRPSGARPAPAGGSVRPGGG